VEVGYVRVAVAVERRRAGKPGHKPVPGYAPLEVISDAAAATVEKFLTDKVRELALASILVREMPPESVFNQKPSCRQPAESGPQANLEIRK
jgi:hypothetical protein